MHGCREKVSPLWPHSFDVADAELVADRHSRDDRAPGVGHLEEDPGPRVVLCADTDVKAAEPLLDQYGLQAGALRDCARLVERRRLDGIVRHRMTP